MEDSASLKGQLLIRSIIEEYRNLLEVLADPHLLVRKSVNPAASFDQTDTRRTTQEILQKLTRLFSQLKTVYNQCLDELERFGGTEIQIQMSSERQKILALQQQDLDENSPESLGTKKLAKDVRDRNNKLKGIIDEMRQLIWDIDIMRRS